MPSFWVISISLAFLIYDAKYVLDMYIVFMRIQLLPFHNV